MRIEKRTQLSKFRLSDHRLEVEVSRYHRPKRIKKREYALNVTSQKMKFMANGMRYKQGNQGTTMSTNRAGRQYPVIRNMNTKD